MMSLMSILRRKEVVLRPEILQKVTDILFPPLVTRRGEKEIYQIDYSVDSNLSAVLEDLEDGINDKSVQNTLRTIVNSLIEVRYLLNAYPILDDESKYVIIDTPDKNKKEVEAQDFYL